MPTNHYRAEVGEIYQCLYRDEYGEDRDEKIVRVIEVVSSHGLDLYKLEVLDPLPDVPAAPQRFDMYAEQFWQWARWLISQKTAPSIFEVGRRYRQGNALTHTFFIVRSIHGDRITIQYPHDKPRSMYLWQLCAEECRLEDWDASTENTPSPSPSQGEAPIRGALDPVPRLTTALNGRFAGLRGSPGGWGRPCE
jgi:hypothetical protein